MPLFTKHYEPQIDLNGVLLLQGPPRVNIARAAFGPLGQY